MRIKTQNKYRAVKTVVGGITFDSKREAKRYVELKLLERNGDISNLETQVKYYIQVNNQTICTYIADFVYNDIAKMQTIREDCKGIRTPVYRLKKKLMKAIYGIEILET